MDRFGGLGKVRHPAVGDPDDPVSGGLVSCNVATPLHRVGPVLVSVLLDDDHQLFEARSIPVDRHVDADPPITGGLRETGRREQQPQFVPSAKSTPVRVGAAARRARRPATRRPLGPIPEPVRNRPSEPGPASPPEPRRPRDRGRRRRRARPSAAGNRATQSSSRAPRPTSSPAARPSRRRRRRPTPNASATAPRIRDCCNRRACVGRSRMSAWSRVRDVAADVVGVADAGRFADVRWSRTPGRSQMGEAVADARTVPDG
ncbi:hypothetical protein BKA15_006572 [Microlunatus parietis]|uniref:Uncharacterized protein n=1 Tax=Microlunatus parietis TaxID=682979 RepID=A0A7Y9IE25_9ACTN|nr:hypothetical protein [Microlunatus parietis]